MSNIKKFVGEYAYKYIENSAYNADALRIALITPQNARAVFADLTEYEIKSLVAEISNTGAIGTVRQTTQEEIKAAFAEHGYTTVIFDDEQAIANCAKYYRDNERICTYNALGNRMREYHMLVAIKENIDNIKHSENPQRDDEYGTSILNIQIARNGSHMSIKNRYNHTVSQCDSTFNNDLNNITMGLQSMVLGYYGFAGLKNKNNRYYTNIVNIGGIYLKYHTEINNKYFGAFVLDGTHGARYTDAGRYYVTSGGVENNLNKLPIILDFHTKTAIDLTGKNVKSPLITRAMHEGVLNSGNKEQAETLITVFPNAKKELLKSNRKALRYAAENYGYDFQKPYKITGILGNFTAKSIEKVTGSDSALLLLSDDGELHAVKLDCGKFQTKDLEGGYYYSIDKFYSQGDFENKRKSGDTALYVIQQDKQYRRTIKEKPCKEMSNTDQARRQLQNRLKVYKANKRRAEAQAKDYTAEIAEIDTEFAKLKAEIITKLISAKTYEEYNAVSNSTNYKFPWLVRDIIKIKDKIATQNFESPQQAYNMIKSVKADISIIWECLNKEDKTLAIA